MSRSSPGPGPSSYVTLLVPDRGGRGPSPVDVDPGTVSVFSEGRRHGVLELSYVQRFVKGEHSYQTQIKVLCLDHGKGTPISSRPSVEMSGTPIFPHRGKGPHILPLIRIFRPSATSTLVSTPVHRLLTLLSSSVRSGVKCRNPYTLGRKKIGFLRVPRLDLRCQKEWKVLSLNSLSCILKRIKYVSNISLS